MANVGTVPAAGAAVKHPSVHAASPMSESVFSVGTMLYTRRSPGPGGHDRLQRHIATRCTTLTSPTFEGAVELARERARADSRSTAQGVFQATDGSYFVTALGYRTPGNRWVPHAVDGPDFDRRFTSVQVEPAVSIFDAVVGAERVIDLRGVQVAPRA